MSNTLLKKSCTTCGEYKIFADFYNHSKMADGKFSECKKCNNERTRKWQRNNPKRTRELNIYANAVRQGVKHNDIILWYNQQLERQGGKCAMPGCNVTAIEHRYGRLDIDHDHVTGRPRALLCNICNLNLGWYESNKEKFPMFEFYLKENDNS